MKTAPLLSIGMIFKNEERCLERCLKSLQPLREAVPCELIMADTGAEDGSRKIAEKYADEVFDFAWVDDFSAARNAVMDRCSGKWYLTIDCDEWLDTDIAELIKFLQSRKKADFAFVIQRNYTSRELEKSEAFNDFKALRLIRMDTGGRYSGAIHESWAYKEPAAQLKHTVLHHDGYFFTDVQTAQKKTKRNMKLLRQKLEQDPENLRTLNQCIESGSRDADLVGYIRRAVQLVRDKHDQWDTYGGCILRHAVETARTRDMPELKEWIELAEQMFPKSVFVQIDVQYAAFRAAHDAEDWPEAIRYGEAYRMGLKTVKTSHRSPNVEFELGRSSIYWGDPINERNLLLGLANAYLHNGQAEKAIQLLAEAESKKFNPEQVRNAIVAICQIHAETLLDTSPLIVRFYEQISLEEPDEIRKRGRVSTFNAVVITPFTKSYQKEEAARTIYRRPAYTVFAALADRCEAGRGAKIMMSADPAEMRAWLLKVEDWQALPIEALEHALKAGVSFPLAEKPLNIEALDGLAARLTHDANLARQLALALEEDTEFESLQSLCWAQALVLAALRSFDWSLGKNSAPVSKFACPEKKKDEDQDERPKDTPEVGLALIRRFAQLESALLPLLYTPALLAEENAALLPPMHRWGLYCARAFAALDAGNPQEYLATLRKGLAACPGEKEMVQFLLDRFLEDARPKTNPELLALAEKIRAILAAYDPDSPAVKAIRESDAYKQVAWIIEETPGIPVQ